MNDVIWEWVKSFIVMLLIVGWIAGAVAIFRINPSKEESKAHFLMMDEDINLALKAGGKIDSKYSNFKNGGALIIVNILAESWSLDLAVKYRKILLSRGWVLKSEIKDFVLCKDGASAEIYLIKELNEPREFFRETYGFTMVYDASTKNDCS